MKESKNDFTLALFTVNSCLACHTQKQALMRFKEFYDWTVKEFDAQENSKLAKNFSIHSAPTIILIRKSPPQWSQLSVGKMPLADIEKTVATGVKMMLNQA